MSPLSIFITLSLVVGLFGALYLYLSNIYDHWRKKGVKYLKPLFFFGNLKEVFLQKKHIAFMQRDFYNELEGEPFGGVFEITRPALVLRDPEMIKTFLIKDFDHFNDRNFTIDEDIDPLEGKNLFMLAGQRWKHMRTLLSPTYTSGRMKKMFHLVAECAEELNRFLKEHARNQDMLEAKEFLGNYTADVTASCAFGIKGNCLKDPNAEFTRLAKEVLDTSGIIRNLSMLVIVFFPSIARMLKLRVLSEELNDKFRSIVRETITHREQTKVRRDDFMDLLMQIRNKGRLDDEDQEVHNGTKIVNGFDSRPKEEFSLDDITAQAMLIIAAGFETSSTTMSFALHELAMNADIQTALRDEIDDVMEQHGGRITYEAIHQMSYLDRIVSETLRKYPTAGSAVNRMCTKDYLVPGTNVVIDKGTSIIVPVYGLHYDPKYYPNPDKFDPDRFTEEGKKSRPNYTYLPFGEGPRNCIGMRFGLMQVKVGLAYIVSKYEVHTCQKTSVPFEYMTTNFNLAPKAGVWVKITERSDSPSVTQ